MKKGQAALEFLTTYGWAFMVVLVMIGALAYFGVVNPNKLLPDKCIFGSGIGCQDFVAVPGASGYIKAQLVNGFGYSIALQSVEVDCSGLGSATCTACEGISTGDPADPAGSEFGCGLGYDGSAADANWASDDMRELFIAVPDMQTSDRPKIEIMINYRKGSSPYEKQVSGELSAKPQE